MGKRGSVSDSNGLTAGWYQDPAGSDALRWWDGAAWTTQLRAHQTPPAAVGVGSWILPSPGNGPGSGFSPAAIAAPVQPLAITASASTHAGAPAAPVGHAAPQMDHYAQATPQHNSSVLTAPEPDYYGQPAAHHDPYAQPAVQPNPLAQLYSEPATQSAPSTESTAGGPTRSAQTAGVWLLALYPALVIPIAVSVQWGADWVLTQLALAFPGSNVIGAAVAIIIGWVFAGADVGRLGKRGYRPPSILWMLLLPPLGYFIARSVALRRDGGKTWPAGIVLGISYAVFAAVVVLMISIVMAVLASFGLLPSAAGLDQAIDDPAVISETNPHTIYGIGVIAEQDTLLGPLPVSTDPYRLRVADLIATDYQFPAADGSSGFVDCWDSQAIIELGSTFPCHVYDLDLPNGVDRSGDISVTLDVDESVSYSVLG